MANPEKPWWEEYRRKHLKFRKVGIELLLRKSLKDVFKEYITYSSLSSVHQFGDPRVIITHRLLLFIIFGLMVAMSCFFVVYTLSSTLASPLIVTMESSTYPISDIDFPAVAICNVNIISKKALRDYVNEIFPYVTNVTKRNKHILKELEWWFYQHGRLLDFKYNESLDTHPFMDYRSKYHISTGFITDRMKRFAPKCEEMLTKCFWESNEYNCTELFAVRRTFRGHCCVFNYVLDYNSGGRTENTIGKVKRQVEPGRTGGLLLFLDPQIQDYGYPTYHMQGFNIFLFDPNTYLDSHVGRVTHRMLEAGRSMLIELVSVKQTATDEVRKYPWATRNCLFRDEIPAFGDLYTYSACLVVCKIKTVQSLCKCTPYFMPTDVNTTEVCTMEKLHCLNKYKEKLLYLYPENSDSGGLEMEIEDSLYCPECLPDCEFTKHFTTISKIPLVVEDFQNKQYKFSSIDNLDLTNKSLLTIYQVTSDGVLNRLDVVSYWFEVLSNFGGFAGVAIGFSIISVCEIIYFFCIRLFQQIYINYKKYH